MSPSVLRSSCLASSASVPEPRATPAADEVPTSSDFPAYENNVRDFGGNEVQLKSAVLSNGSEVL
eukprot:6217039-Prymnesium_polylepis.1